MEKEARRERKTGSAPKVAEKGGWTAHRESARKKDGRAGHGKRWAAGEVKETRRREEFEGVGCRHRRGRRRFLPRCRRRHPHPPSRRRRFSPRSGQASSFFLLFPIIDKTETAQYRDTASSRGVGKRSLSATLLS